LAATNDYYSALGLKPSSSAQEIKRAYRQMVFRYHPDRNPGNDQAAEKFKQVLDAYNILSDAAERAEYDAAMHPEEVEARAAREKQKKTEERKSEESVGNGFGFTQSTKSRMEAEPKCPTCSVQGADNIISRRAGSAAGRGKQFIVTPINVIFCKSCGHVYGVTASGS
jgi:curved DNA-binding protein CbpA